MLNKLLKTIPKQNDIQIIVIDDNSNKYIEEYKQVKSFYHGKNIQFLRNDVSEKGAGTCRNIGFNHSRGEYILFADSDDFFAKNFYNTVKEYFDSKYDIVFFSPKSLDIVNNKLSKRHVKYEKLVHNYNNSRSKKNEKLLRYTYYVPWSKMYLSSFLKENNIKFQEVIVSNDVLFSTKAGYKASDFMADKRTIYYVTKSHDSLITKKKENTQIIRFNVFTEYVQFLDKNNISLDFLNNNFIKLKFLLRVFLKTYSFKHVIYYYKKIK